MTDWWARLTRGRAVSRETLVDANATAYRNGFNDGEVAARLRHYVTPQVSGDNLTSASFGDAAVSLASAKPGNMTSAAGDMAAWGDDTET